jgi:hypothetical protein
MWSAKHWRQGTKKILRVSEYLQHFCDTSLPEKYSAHKTELTSQIESNKRSFKSLKAANPRKWKRSNTKPLQHLCDTYIFPWKLLSTQNWIDVSHYCQEKNTRFKKKSNQPKDLSNLGRQNGSGRTTNLCNTSATDTTLPGKKLVST